MEDLNWEYMQEFESIGTYRKVCGIHPVSCKNRLDRHHLVNPCPLVVDGWFTVLRRLAKHNTPCTFQKERCALGVLFGT